MSNVFVFVLHEGRGNLIIVSPLLNPGYSFLHHFLLLLCVSAGSLNQFNT